MPSGLFEPTSCSASKCATTGQQHQRHGDHVEAEEAVQRRVAHHVVATDQQGQVRTDEGNGGNRFTITWAPQYDIWPQGSR